MADKRNLLFVALLVVAGWLGACGDDGESAQVDGAVEAPSGDSTQDDGGAEPTEAAQGLDDADFASQILLATSGLLPSDIGISDEDLACMNAELAAALPDGLPENIPASSETLQALDDASLACQVTFAN